MLGTEILPLMQCQPFNQGPPDFVTQTQAKLYQLLLPAKTALAYSASMTPNADLGDQLITITTGAAFTINAPIGNPIFAQMMAFQFKNTSGGAVGAVTLNAIFKAPALVLPATGFNRWYQFFFDGTSWNFIWQTAADVPN